MSPKSMSPLSPREMKWEKPMSPERAQSRTVVHSAPDWEMKAIFPGSMSVWEKLAFRPMAGTIIPRQLGPRMRSV